MLRRVLISLFTIFMAMTLTFVLIRNMPGDVIMAMALDKANSEGIPFEIAYEQVKGLYGVAPEKSLFQQYLDYVASLLRGDLGKSVHYEIPITRIIIAALPWTVFVLSISLTLSFIIGSLAGMMAVWRRKTLLDPIVSAYASITDATPDYITAIILLIIFAVRLKWFPLTGAYDGTLTPGFSLPFILSALHHAFLPIMAYTIESLGGWALIMKANAVRVLGEDYVAAARAKGLKDRRIAIHYVGRNAVLPSVTALAMAFGGMLGGSTLIESTFAYPGIGFFFAKAVSLRDYPLIQGLFLLTTGGMIVANFIADLLYSRLDPRVRLGE